MNNKYQTTSKCIALTNFSSSRSVILNNLNVDDILKTKNDFNRIYLESTNRVNKFIQQLMSELQFEKELVLAKFVSFIFLWIVISGISFKFRPKKKQQLQAPTFKANSEKEKEELLQKIARGRQVLESGKFTDEISIQKYEDYGKQTYEDYRYAKDLCEKKLRKAGALTFLILGLLCFA